jgi:hypothetical protein
MIVPKMRGASRTPRIQTRSAAMRATAMTRISRSRMAFPVRSVSSYSALGVLSASRQPSRLWVARLDARAGDTSARGRD